LLMASIAAPHVLMLPQQNRRSLMWPRNDGERQGLSTDQVSQSAGPHRVTDNL
jgi:hypothetical protein